MLIREKQHPEYHRSMSGSGPLVHTPRHRRSCSWRCQLLERSRHLTATARCRLGYRRVRRCRPYSCPFEQRTSGNKFKPRVAAVCHIIVLAVYFAETSGRCYWHVHEALHAVAEHPSGIGVAEADDPAVGRLVDERLCGQFPRLYGINFFFDSSTIKSLCLP